MSLLSEIVSRTPPGLLYHYTSQAGLLGIIGGKKIWATKIQYLNDASEFSYAFQLLDKSFRDAAKRQKELRPLIRTARMVVRLHEEINIFAASFSEEGDLLSQWRAYCPPSGGYSLGFTHDVLEEAIQAQRFFLAPCVYDEDEQLQLIEEWTNRLLAGSDDEQIYKMTGELLQIASIIKHPSFSEEREWRLVSRIRMYTEPQIDFRPGASMLIPYFNFSLVPEDEEIPVSSICIGPTPHKKEAHAAVRGLLIKHGIYASDMIRFSNTPYRTW